ncbi:MAG: HAMP domain-containing histidine kinase [Rhodoferax sp.]|nr:HAMP domain-containing histidine kinase [Rhodoferax sp.]
MTPAHGHRPWMRRARHALAHSLRVRMVALFLLLALTLVGVFLAGMQVALSAGWRDVARPVVSDYVDRLASEIGSPPRVDRAAALVQRLPLSVRISGPAIQWESEPRRWSRQDEERWRGDERRILERTTADGHRIEFGLSVAAWSDRPRFIGWITLGVLLALVCLAYLRVRRMLRPLDDIRAGALRFGQGDFAQPIGVPHAHRPDELGELAATINTMASDIAGMLDAKRALLLAISHELRSPLTRARLHTELLPDTPEVAPARDGLLRDLGVMRDLVTDLLESERLAARHAALQRERVDLPALVASVVTELGANASLQATGPALPALPLDAARVRLLVRNLLSNALRHNPEGAPPVQLQWESVASAAAEPVAVLTVRDFGPGVPEAQQARLAQPFFRPDASRGRDTGGVGLGLYLCRLVAQAHGGSLQFDNAHPGLRVTARLG